MFRPALAFAVLFALASTVRADDFRLWKDSTGKFSVRAKFVSQAGGKVTLEKEDGTTVELPVARLSAADRAHLLTIKAADSDDPFKPKPKSETPAEGDPKELTPDVSKARTVGLSAAPDKWVVEVGPAAAIPGELSAEPVALPAKRGFFEGVKGFAVSAAARKAVVGYTLAEPGKRTDGSTRVEVCDLAAGKRVGGGTVDGSFVPVALADDGVRVLVRTDVFGFGNSDKLELWTVGESGVKRVARWAPHDDLKGADRDVKWAAFVGPQRLATAGNSGRLTVWDLAPAGSGAKDKASGPQPASGDAPAVTAVYQLQMHAGSTPALSPDRKLIAFSTDRDIGMLDVAAGKVVAVRPATPGAWPALAFSPSGKRLARLSMDKLTVWDTATGKPEREIGTLGVHAQTPPVWPTDDHVLVGNRILVDVESQVKLWEYQGADHVLSLGGVCWFVASDGERPGALVPARVPAAGAKDKLDEALADPDFFVLKPGTAVKLTASGIADETEREKAEAALAGRLRAAGFTVDPAGTIELVASTEIGKERDVSYRSFGAFGSRIYKFKDHYAKVKFVTEGKTAWEMTATNGPGFMVSLAEGETMEQYLKKHEKPNYAFFGTVELPRRLTKPTGSAALGSSKVTTAGVR